MAALIPAGMKALGFVGKHWSWFAMGALALTLAIDHARLTHAKNDQLDRRVCVAHAPCHPVKWKDEALAAEKSIDFLSRQHVADATSIANLQAAIAQQNAAIDQAKAAGDARDARAAQMVAEARQTAKTAQARAQAALAAKPGTDACKSADDVILGSVR